MPRPPRSILLAVVVTVAASALAGRPSAYTAPGNAAFPGGADGSRLFVRHLDAQITEVRLLRGRREGRIGTTITSDGLMFPTTAAADGDRLLVVSSQVDKRGGTPVLPFTVASVAVAPTLPRRVPWHAGA